MPETGAPGIRKKTMKLFVGNVSYDTADHDLREIFEPYEPIVEYVRPIDRETGKPRGFAFVTVADEETGMKAIEELDGKELDGRSLRVNEAEERRDHRPRRSGPSFDELTHGGIKRVDDRPTDDDGKKVVYKSI